MTGIDDKLHSRINTLCAVGDALGEEGDFDAALDKYWEAFDLLPHPKTDWEAGTWLLGAIGDANFQRGDFAIARDILVNAMQFPDAVGNPFLHLRLGQCQFELGSLNQAEEELMRAYKDGGADVFAHEDRKYLEFVASHARRLKPPRKNPFWKIWSRNESR